MGRPIVIKTGRRTSSSKFKVLAHSKLTHKSYIMYADSKSEATRHQRSLKNDFKIKIRKVK